MTDRTTPFLRDVPLGEAQSAWRRCRVSAACPERVQPVRVAIGGALGRVTAEPIWATRSSPPFDSAAMDGIAVRAADTVGAGESTPLLLPGNTFGVADTGDPLPEQFDAVVMREDVHYVAGQADLRAAFAPYQHVRSIGEDISATELLLPVGHRMLVA
jgi:putative molybdopterin biosynthesis protein